MIISQTPYRVSFAGGSTDLPSFYREEYGAVISVAIKKHMYVTVSPRFEPSIRVSYTRTEIADTLDDLKHELVREALRRTELDRSIEITTIGDLPGGTGMGSSSSLTCGLLKALYAYKGRVISPEEAARWACEIEIDDLGKPIGRQDQYAAAYGGFNYIRFNRDDTVLVEPVPCRPEVMDELQSRTLLMYTGMTRSADTILKQVVSNTEDRRTILRRMRDLAAELREVISTQGDVDRFAELMHEGWELKKKTSSSISGSMIDDWYESARKAGATGGKLLGAGGGGFLLVMAPPERHEAIREALGRPREIPFEIDPAGCRLIFLSDHQH